MLLAPAYKLLVGDRVVDTTDEPRASTVVDLLVRLDMDTPADSATVVLGNAGGLDPAREDELQVDLGYADNGGFTRVLTGRVSTVDRSLLHKRVIGHTAAATLLNSYLDRTYENKTAGDIVRDLASQADVATGIIQPGATYPAYVINSQRNFYQHLRDLATLSGFDLYFNSDGQLMFHPFQAGRAVHVFKFGQHIIELDIEEAPAAAGTVEAWGESPGAARGDESWAWLTKDFANARGTAGSAGPKLIVERSALRTGEAAAGAARGMERDLRARALRGRLRTYGRPQVKLGDALLIQDVPDGRLNQSLQVRAVEHRITKARGFTTAVEFRGAV